MNSHTLKPAKLERLKRGFIAQGMDINLNNYECLGSQWALSDNMIKSDNRLHKNVEQGVITTDALPPLVGQCFCGHYIRENCIIRHWTTKRVFVIGSCCYKALTNAESRKQVCTVDGCTNRHSNSRFTVCNDHKKEAVAKTRAEARTVRRKGVVIAIEGPVVEKPAPTPQDILQRVIVEEPVVEKLSARQLIGEERFRFGNTWNDTKIKDIGSGYVDWIIKNEIRNPRVDQLLRYHGHLEMQAPPSKHRFAMGPAEKGDYDAVAYPSDDEKPKKVYSFGI